MSFKELVGRTTDKNQSLKDIQSVEGQAKVAEEVQFRGLGRVRMVFEGGEEQG